MEFWDYFMCNIMSPTKIDNRTSSFSLANPLTFFSCFVALVSASSTVLKMNMNSVNLYFIHNFTGITLSFSPFRFMELWVCHIESLLW